MFIPLVQYADVQAVTDEQVDYLGAGLLDGAVEADGLEDSFEEQVIVIELRQHLDHV